MQRRSLLISLGLALAGVLTPVDDGAASAAKQETVTLAITGMT
jgi:hypothetical protein